MKTVTLLIGNSVTISAMPQDDTRTVEFEAEELASETWFTGGDDTRGIKQTLYKTIDGRLVVHVEDWSRWQGEPTTYSLTEIEEEDLKTAGDFERLGFRAGYGRPLTLDEALD